MTVSTGPAVPARRTTIPAWLSGFRRRHVPNAVAVVFFLVLPAFGGWLILDRAAYAVEQRLVGPFGLELVLVAAAAPALVGGFLVRRRQHIGAYWIGAMCLLLYLLFLTAVYGVRLGPGEALLPLAAAVAGFGGGELLRRRVGRGRGRALAVGVASLVSVVLLVAPTVHGFVWSSGRMGWTPVRGSETVGVDFSLPPDFSGSYFGDLESSLYLYYGGTEAGADVAVRAIPGDAGDSAADVARWVDRPSHSLGWGLPDGREEVVVNETTWLVGEHRHTSERTGAGDRSTLSGDNLVPAWIVDAIGVEGGRAVQIGVIVRENDDLDVARGLLLDILDTVFFPG